MPESLWEPTSHKKIIEKFSFIVLKSTVMKTKKEDLRKNMESDFWGIKINFLIKEKTLEWYKIKNIKIGSTEASVKDKKILYMFK